MTKRKLIYIILISFYMMLLMGSVYAYSIFRTEVKNIYQVNTLVSGLPYMLSLSFYALSMMITGRYINDKNLRQIVFLGSMMIVLGFFCFLCNASFYNLYFFLWYFNWHGCRHGIWNPCLSYAKIF